ncbi:hypothetical protein MRB53_041251 [Persea americana]|nr:hypothetical protein MRB53_041251 [Persea americana]
MTDSRQMMLMRQARERISFDGDALTNIIHDGASRAQARRDAWRRVEQAIGTADTSTLPAQYRDTSREGLYEEGLQSGVAHWTDSIRHNHDFFDSVTPRYALINSSPFGLNTMFRKAIELQASDEQRKSWLPMIYGGRWNGSYIQTELGHGTKFTHLETRARYHRESDEFDLHTPTTTATKFWPGCLGYSATHGVIMARLVLPDETGSDVDYGVHLFLLPIRDDTTGEVTPGVEVGDIGLKPAHNQNDNGYAIFNHVRISRTNMLMGEHSVDAQGNYTKVAHAKAMHQTMTSIRSYLPLVCALQLAQAVTIASRYSVVREQGHLPFSERGAAEIQIVNYKSQNFRLLTALSKAYAIMFASKHVEAVQRDLEVRRSMLDFSTFDYSHALQAGMKAWASDVAAQSAEDARKCCGGQGYLNTSGLPEIVASLTAICTLEGDNYALWQQTAGYLTKTLQSRGSSLETEVQEEEVSLKGTPDFLSPRFQLSLYRQRAAGCIKKAAERLSKANLTSTRSEAWNTEMMSLITAARAHVEYVVLQQFWSAVEALSATGQVSSSVLPVLKRLCSLFALSSIINPSTTDALTFLEHVPNLALWLDDIRDVVNDLLATLLPDLIGLTDAWDFSDASLASAIGMRDGNCYETLLNWTRQLPINVRARANGGIDPNFHSGVRPGLLDDLDAAGGVPTPPGSLHLFSDSKYRWK